MAVAASAGICTGTSIPKGARIALVTTRRAQPAADALSGNICAKYILHDMMASVTAPLHELSSAHLIALEVPPIVTAGFERDLLNFVHKLLALCIHVVVVVQPSIRRRSNKTLWVHKWNFLPNVPFMFTQTCSCMTGNAVPGCHLTCYVGSSKHVHTYPCADIPTLSTSPQASLNCLGGTFKFLSLIHI